VRPPSKPGPTPDRGLPAAPLRPHPPLRHQTQQRQAQPTRDPALRQALHRPRDIPRPTRRPRSTQPDLTSIGTSLHGSPLGYLQVPRPSARPARRSASRVRLENDRPRRAGGWSTSARRLEIHPDRHTPPRAERRPLKP
jgi:hypothetical protein